MRVIYDRAQNRSLRTRLFAYLKPHWRLLSFALLCAIGSSLVALSVPWVVAQVVLVLTSAHTTPAARHHLSSEITLIAFGFVGLYMLKWLFSVGQSVWLAEVGQRIGMRLRNDIYSHLQSLSLSYFDQHRTGDLISTLNNDVPVLQGGVSSIKDAVSGPIIFVGAFGALFFISWRMALLTIFLLPPIGFVINFITKRQRAIQRATQDRLSDITVITEETISSARVVRSFSAERREIARFLTQTLAVKKIIMEGVVRSSVLSPTTDLIGAVGVCAALLFGTQEVLSGHLTVPDLAKFIVMLDRVRNGIGSMGGIMSDWRQTQGAAERIFTKVLDVPTEVVESPNAVPLRAVEGTVQFDQISFAYVPTRPVLQNISFTMNPGEVVAVVGPSGAGKSTLADLIPRFYDPTSGAILIDGLNIRNVTMESLRRQIGIVPQETMLFNMSVRDNIAYGLPESTDHDITSAAIAANAHNFIMDMPNAYETVVGDRGVQLSGGQRQRIAIARAVLLNPRILILDEATSSLDTVSEAEVQKALEVLMKGRTTLVIAHRLSTVVKADKILVLQDGSIIESGSHSELVGMAGAYAQLYSKQFRSQTVV